MENERYYLRLYDVSFEVTKEQYVEYYRERRRAKYLEEADAANGLVHYQELDTDNYSGEELLCDKDALTENIVENNDMLEKLKKCLDRLDKSEQELIYEIYFNEKTLRKLSEETGIAVMTIQYRKQRILDKLKKLLEI